MPICLALLSIVPLEENHPACVIMVGCCHVDNCDHRMAIIMGAVFVSVYETYSIAYYYILLYFDAAVSFRFRRDRTCSISSDDFVGIVLLQNLPWKTIKHYDNHTRAAYRFYSKSLENFVLLSFNCEPVFASIVRLLFKLFKISLFMITRYSRENQKSFYCKRRTTYSDCL